MARGFATLTPEQRREVSRRGGVAAHKSGHAHEWGVAEAKAAGRLGGLKIAENRARMSELSKLGHRAKEAQKKAERAELEKEVDQAYAAGIEAARAGEGT